MAEEYGCNVHSLDHSAKVAFHTLINNGQGRAERLGTWAGELLPLQI